MTLILKRPAGAGLILKRPVGAGLELARDFTWNETVWNPSMIPGLALWLDAADASTITLNGSNVSQWNDKSGGAWNATQSTAAMRPTLTANALNGRSVLTFNGANTQHLVHSRSVSPAPHSVFAVARRTTGGSSAFQVIINAVAPNSSFGVSLSAKIDGASSDWGSYITSWVSSGSSILNAWSIIGIASPTATSGTETYSTNGNLVTVNYSSRWPGDSSNRRAIGGDPVFNTGWLWGDIGEIIILSTAASTDVRQRIEGYLAHKWGLTANLPADHPYKTLPPLP